MMSNDRLSEIERAILVRALQRFMKPDEATQMFSKIDRVMGHDVAQSQRLTKVEWDTLCSKFDGTTHGCDPRVILEKIRLACGPLDVSLDQPGPMDPERLKHYASQTPTEKPLHIASLERIASYLRRFTEHSVVANAIEEEVAGRLTTNKMKQGHEFVPCSGRAGRCILRGCHYQQGPDVCGQPQEAH